MNTSRNNTCKSRYSTLKNGHSWRPCWLCLQCSESLRITTNTVHKEMHFSSCCLKTHITDTMWCWALCGGSLTQLCCRLSTWTSLLVEGWKFFKIFFPSGFTAWPMSSPAGKSPIQVVLHLSKAGLWLKYRYIPALTCQDIIWIPKCFLGTLWHLTVASHSPAASLQPEFHRSCFTHILSWRYYEMLWLY